MESLQVNKADLQQKVAELTEKEANLKKKVNTYHKEAMDAKNEMRKM